MANKIKLGSAPKTFKPVTVTVDMPDGTKGEIPLTFNYRTQDEFYKYQDSFIGSLKKKDEQEESGEKEEFSFQKASKESREHAAKHLLSSIASWGLDEELTEENIRQLLNEIPAAGAAIGAAYQLACINGRLGN